MYSKRKSPRKEAMNLGVWTLQIHFPMVSQHPLPFSPFSLCNTTAISHHGRDWAYSIVEKMHANALLLKIRSLGHLCEYRNS